MAKNKKPVLKTAITMPFSSIAILMLVAGTPSAYAGNGNDKVNAENQSISKLNCSDGQIAKYNQTSDLWECAVDNDTIGSDTLAELSCSTDQIVKYTGTAWTCADDETGDDSTSGTTYVVKDSADAIIGEANTWGLPNSVRTIANIMGHQVPLDVTHTKILPTVSWQARYESIDCSTTPWFLSTNVFPQYDTTVIVEGDPVRVLEINSPIATDVPIRSIMMGSYCEPLDMMDPNFFVIESVVSTQEIVPDLSVLFPPPYTVEVQ